jgi:hypothetical protein
MDEVIALRQQEKEEKRRQEKIRLQNSSLSDLNQLRYFNGMPAEFWPRFIKNVSSFLQAAGAMVLLSRTKEEWQKLDVWPREDALIRSMELQEFSGRLATKVKRDDSHQTQHVNLSINSKKYTLLGHKLPLPDDQPVTILICMFSLSPPLIEVNKILQLISTIPEQYLLRNILDRSNRETIHSVRVLDLMIAINESKVFQHASMVLCNELSNYIVCDRVSFGWMSGPYVRVYAMSHMEKFDRKTEAVQELENIMEESIDQDIEIFCPSPSTKNNMTVSRSHQRYAKSFGLASVLTVPIRMTDNVIGAITCERSHGGEFTSDEALMIRMCLDQAVYQLSEFHSKSIWFGARWYRSFKKGLGWLFGVEKTLIKSVSILFSALLLYLIFGSLPYRVESPFILKTDSLSFLNAPFDGFIDDVSTKTGNSVRRGDLLVQLDTSRLLLQESEAIADVSRYQREEEKARADRELADMRIAEAMKDQALAKLNEVQYFLNRASLYSPTDGIIVEGQLEKMLGAPVKQGDILFKVASLDKLYAEMDVDERYMHELTENLTGEFTFISKPELHFPLTIERINTIAEVKNEINSFVVRGKLASSIEPWWRPGMSGIAKIDLGDRRPWWIILHKTIDFVRLWIWW